jgi:Tol biopolymer transport system component
MSRDGTLAMITTATAYQIALVGADGGVQRLVVPDSVGDGVPRFSPNGRRLLLVAPLGQGHRETWIVNLASGVTSQLSMGFQPGVAEWTADGRAVLAVSRSQLEKSLRGLWRRPADASAGAERVMPDFGKRKTTGVAPKKYDWRSVGSIAVHPDGVKLALTVDVGSNPMQRRWDIYIGRLDGDTTLVPFATSSADEVAPRFSPDGRWLAYASNESGRFEVYVRPFPGPGARVQVSAEGGGQPIWSRDGSRIFYRTDDALMAADVHVRAGVLVVDGRRRLFQGTFRGGPGSVEASYDVSPDGKRFAILPAVGESAGDIVVWKDWLDELRPLLKGGK